MMAKAKRLEVLIVEDQVGDLKPPYMLLLNLGHRVTLTFDGDQGLSELLQRHFDLVILDLNMPHADGWALLDQLDRRTSPGKAPLSVILHTGEVLDENSVSESDGFKIVEIWRKPVLVTEMSKSLKAVIEKLGA